MIRSMQSGAIGALLRNVAALAVALSAAESRARNVILFVDKQPVTPGEVVLSVESVYAESDRGLPAVRGVSLNVRSGEIVGLAGVAGNGQRELADAINGLRKCQQGRVLLQGEEVSNKPIRKNIRGGMAYVPEDRTHVR